MGFFKRYKKCFIVITVMVFLATLMPVSGVMAQEAEGLEFSNSTKDAILGEGEVPGDIISELKPTLEPPTNNDHTEKKQDEDFSATALNEEGDTLSTQATGDNFSILYFDANGQEVQGVTLPEAITLKLVDENNQPLDTNIFDITWYRKLMGDRLEELGHANELVFPYTTMDHTGGYPIVADVIRLGSGDDPTRVEAGDYATDSGITFAIADHTAILPGQSAKGVSLSADGKTVSLQGVNINDTVEDIWGAAALLVQTHQSDINVFFNGDNYITSTSNNGFIIEDRTNDASINIMGGGTLFVETNCSDYPITPVIMESEMLTININEGSTFNLKAKGGDDHYSSGAFHIGNYASLNVYDGAIFADADSYRTINIEGQGENSLFIGEKGSLNVINSCPSESHEEYGGTSIAGVYFEGEGAVVIDGGEVNITMTEQLSREINGFLATHSSDTVVKNGGKLNTTLKMNNETENAVEIGGIVSQNITVDNATVNVKIDTQEDRFVATWGIAFDDTLTIRNGSEVNIDINGGLYSGIYYGGPMGNEVTSEIGTVYVKNSNLNINGTAKHDVPSSATFYSSGIYARYLKTDFINSNYSLNINTTDTNVATTALFLQKNNTAQKEEYNPFYVSNRTAFGELDGILAPENGNVNLFGYLEDPSDTEYICAEMVYGTDKTKPAPNLKIGQYGFIYTELKSMDGNVSVTGNINRDAKLEVVPNKLHDDCAVCNEMLALATSNKALFLGDVSLTGTAPSHLGTLYLSFKVPESVNGKRVYVIHCLNGQAEKTELIAQNNLSQLSVNELSPFLLYTKGDAPTPTPTPVPTPAPTPINPDTPIVAPKTADSTNITMYIWLGIIAFGVIVGVVVGRRRVRG